MTDTLAAPDVTVLSVEDFSPACAMHEVRKDDPPPCGRAATLSVHMHECDSTISCQPCWNFLLGYIKSQAAASDNAIIYKCMLCKRKSANLEELIWAQPL